MQKADYPTNMLPKGSAMAVQRFHLENIGMKKECFLRIPVIAVSAVLFGLLFLVVAIDDANSEPAKKLKLAGSYKTKETNGACYVCIAGKRAYIISGDSEKGLSVLDISNPKKPKVESSIRIPYPLFEGFHLLHGLRHNKSYIYTYDSKQNFWVIKVSKKKLKVVGKVLHPEDGGSMITFGNDWIRYDNSRVYIKSPKGVKIYDVKSAKKPKLTGLVEIEKLESFRVSGKYLFAETREGLLCYDVSSPKNAKKIVCVCEKPSSYCIQKGMLYVTESSKGLSIYSLSGIKGGKPKGVCSIKESGLKVLTAGGDCAWVQFWKKEQDVKKFYVQGIDVSDPAKPVPFGKAEFESEADSIITKEMFVVIGAKKKNLVVFDFTDKKKPKTICNFSLPFKENESLGMELDMDKKYIYAWNCYDRLLIFNLPKEMK